MTLISVLSPTLVTFTIGCYLAQDMHLVQSKAGLPWSSLIHLILAKPRSMPYYTLFA